MAEYIYIDDMSNRGKLAIHYRVFDNLVNEALSRIKGISKSSKMLKKNQKFRLNRPVQTSIHRGIVHVLVSVDVSKGNSLQDVVSNIQEEVNNTLLLTTETVPFDVQVRVETIV
ncbi:MAG: Asp23/Gls24 family envelope stress response protein [Bacilli bacterium]|nr:Asp23/Gls24 family envelope stress response protein [Bacilli bacterium]